MRTILLSAATLTLLALAISGHAAADTTVPGQTLSTNVTWTLAGSPYVVTGTVTVAGASDPILTIEPGVEVRFGTGGALTIGSGSQPGTLRANGTGASPVRFGSAAATPGAGDWSGLRFQGPGSSGPSFLVDAVVEHAGRNGRASVEILDHPVTVEDVSVRDGASTGVYVSNARPLLKNVSIERHARGFHAESNAVPTLDGVTIAENDGIPLRARLDQDLGGTSFVNNSVARVELHGVDVTASRTLSLPEDERTGAAYEGVVLSAFTIRNSATWTIEPGARVLVSPWVQIQVGTFGQAGSLRAEGTQAEPIVFDAASGATGWYGFSFRGDSAPVGSSALRNVTIAHSLDDGVNAYAYRGLVLDNVTLAENARAGFRLESTTPTLRNVHAVDNGWEGGVFSSSPATWDGGSVVRSGRSGVYLGGCGVATLRNLVIDSPNGHGTYADSTCNGAHLDNVTIRDAASRPWRNRIDLRHDATVLNASATEVEYWGATLTANTLLARTPDLQTGARLTPVILSTVDVRSGATLTIAPNTTVLFADFTMVNVGTFAQRASLVAEGTEAEPIALLARGGAAANGWYGLYFRGDSAPLGASALRNVTIAHSRDDGFETYQYSGLVVDNATLVDNARYGFRLESSAPTIHDVEIRRAGWEGAYWSSSAPLIERVLIEDTGRSGIYIGGCGVGTLRDVVIRDAQGYGLFADGACNGAHLDGVTIENVTGIAWRNRLDAREDVTVVGAGIAQVEYWGTTLGSDRTLAAPVDAGNGGRLTPVILTGFEVRGGATLTIPTNTTVLFGDFAWLNVGTFGQKATLDAQGTEAEPIVLRSRSGSVANGWYGLYFRGDSAPAGESVLRNVTLLHSRDDGLESYAYGGLLLDNVTFEDHGRHGLLVTSASPTLRNVHVFGGGGDGAHFQSSSSVWRGGDVARAGGSGISTSGCGVIVLDGLTIDSPLGYGFHATSACSGAHLDDVLIEGATRPWRNRIDLRADATVVASGVDEVEHWGATLTSDLTLPRVVDQLDGERLSDVLLSGLDVRNGATLTLHAGTTLLAEEWTWINVGTFAQGGSLVAEGTEGEPVRILARSGGATNGWYGFHFRGDSAPQGTTLLRNVTIAHSRDHGLDMYHYRGFELDNVTIELNAANGLHAYGPGPGPALVRASHIQRNAGDGVHVELGTLRVVESNLSRNGANGFEVRHGTTARLENSTVYDNLRSGVNVTAGDPTLLLWGNHFWTNGGYGVDLGGASGSLIVNNAFAQNRHGQATADGLHTWNLTKTEGRNVAGGAYLGGNVWSDYAGTDTDGDGLGDTLLPYARAIGPGTDWHPVIGDMYADFRVTVPDIVGAPQELAFEDATLGGLALPTRWHWSFGDGGEAATRIAVHRFPADGTYPVTLTVWNGRGQTATVTKNVVVDSEAPHSLAHLAGTLGLDDWYVSAVEVALEGVDTGGGVSAIRWRIGDGAFSNYLGPFTVWGEGALVLEHYAIDLSGNVGPTSTVAFRVDRTAPDVQPVVLNGTLGRDGWYVSDVLVALEATDGVSGLASLHHAVDAEPNLTYEAPLPVTEDGVWALRYRAVDLAGNVAEDAFLVRRDTTLPQISGNESGLVGGSGWYVGNATVNLTGSDATSGVIHLNASVDAGPWFEVTGPFEIEGDGMHTLNVTATDAAGNVLDVPSRTIRIEATAPVAEARVDVALAGDGWHRIDPDVAAGETWIPLSPIEGKPGPATLHAAVEAFQAWLQGLGLLPPAA